MGSANINANYIGHDLRFTPSDLSGLTVWLDDPNIPSNITESAFRVSQWFDISGDSNNFPQSTGADQGLRTGQFIEYDGVTEFQDGTGVLSSFASDTQGELFIVAHELEGTGVTTDLFGAGDASGTANFMRFSMLVGDTLALLMRVGGVNQNIIFGAAPRNQKMLISWRSSGTAYGAQINGVESAVSVGVDNGDWFTDVPLLDTLAISATIRSSSLFFNNRIYSVIYCNRQLTAAERLLVNKFLNFKFSIGLSL